MTYITKNDYRHGNTRKGYATADAAAINWTELRVNTISRFRREHHLAENLGEFIVRTGAPY
jgi:hypothetical protein